jgi:hypothetical protein
MVGWLVEWSCVELSGGMDWTGIFFYWHFFSFEMGI